MCGANFVPSCGIICKIFIDKKGLILYNIKWSNVTKLYPGQKRIPAILKAPFFYSIAVYRFSERNIYYGFNVYVFYVFYV